MNERILDLDLKNFASEATGNQLSDYGNFSSARLRQIEFGKQKEQRSEYGENQKDPRAH